MTTKPPSVGPGTPEEAPTAPEQVPGGETMPVVPPKGDVQTGSPVGVQMTNVWTPEKVLPKLDSVLTEGLSPSGLVSPDELEAQLVAQGYQPEDAQEVTNRAMGLQMTAASGKGLGGLLGKLFKGTTAEQAAQTVRGASSKAPGALGRTEFEPNWASARSSREALQADLNKFINTFKDEYEAARKGKTDEEVEKELEKAMRTKYPDVMKALDMRGSSLTQVQTRAMLAYLQAALDEYHQALAAAAKNAPGSVEALTKQTALVQALMMKLLPQRREAGAVLREYGRDVANVSQGHAVLDAADLTASVAGMDVDPQRLAQVLQGLGREQRVRVLAQSASRRLMSAGARATGDEIASLYVDSLLLGFGVQQRNFTGNLFRALTFVPERMAEGIVGRASMAFGSKEIHYLPGEAGEMVAAMPSAMRQAIIAFSKITKTGESSFYGRKVDMKHYRNILQRESMPLSVQRLGHFWAVGSRGLFYADEAFKMYIYQMEKAAASYRYAQMLGSDAAQRGELFSRFMVRTPQPIVDEAMESAAIGTMTAPGGRVMTMAQNFADGYNPYTRMMMPFVTATGNMAKQSYQRTPILNMISYEHWDAVTRQGGRRADAAIARMGSGLLLGSVFAEMAAQEVLTGSGNMWSPAYRRAKEEQGWKACSVRVGGKYIPVKDMGPWATSACATADIVEAYDHMTPTEWQSTVQTFGQAYGMLLSETAFMDSLGRFFEALRDDDPDKFSTYAAKTAAGFIPKGAQEIADVMSPGRVMKQAEGGVYDQHFIARELGILANEVVAKTPIAKGSLLPLDRGPIEGDILTSSALYGLYKGASPKGERVVDALSDSVPFQVFDIQKSVGGEGMVQVPGQPGLPSRVPGVTILPEDRSELLRIRGEIKLDGKRMVDELHDLVTGEEWKSLSRGPGGTRERVVKRIVQAYTKASLAQFSESYGQGAYPGGGPGGILEQKGTIKERKGQRKAGER